MSKSGSRVVDASTGENTGCAARMGAGMLTVVTNGRAGASRESRVTRRFTGTGPYNTKTIAIAARPAKAQPTSTRDPSIEPRDCNHHSATSR